MKNHFFSIALFFCCLGITQGPLIGMDSLPENDPSMMANLQNNPTDDNIQDPNETKTQTTNKKGNDTNNTATADSHRTNSQIITIINYTDKPATLKREPKTKYTTDSSGERWIKNQPFITVKTIAPNSTKTISIKKNDTPLRIEILLEKDFDTKSDNIISSSGISSGIIKTKSNPILYSEIDPRVVFKQKMDHWTVWGNNDQYTFDVSTGTSKRCPQKNLDSVITVANYADEPCTFQLKSKRKWTTIATIAPNAKKTATINNKNKYRIVVGQNLYKVTYLGKDLIANKLKEKDHLNVSGKNGLYVVGNVEDISKWPTKYGPQNNLD